MSGHSKWANIKRKKAVVDQQRGKVFSKLAREIMVAARQGGANPEANFRLKAAIEKARSFNMPLDNIQRAIARGSGGGDAGQLEELVYEGYGPGGIAILLEVMTDNRNRTAGEIRHIFSRRGGTLAESGSVAWMFERKASLRVEAPPESEERIVEALLDVGAEDVRAEDDGFVVVAAPEDLQAVNDALTSAGFRVVEAEIVREPKVRSAVAPEEAKRLFGLLEALEEHDDVQAVYANFDLSEAEVAQALGQE
jgi:YebC/PmpR family DNA-binding regulatory protein